MVLRQHTQHNGWLILRLQQTLLYLIIFIFINMLRVELQAHPHLFIRKAQQITTPITHLQHLLQTAQPPCNMSVIVKMSAMQP